jgi:hypothetical protein
MRIGLLPFALSLSLAAGAATADVIVLPEGEPVPEIKLPAKGMTMADVEKKYGEPRNRQPTVGGGSPQQPPITRWDYDGFAVIFEHDRVVDGVIPGAPPRIYNKDELQQVSMPSAMPIPVQEAAPEPPPDDASAPAAVEPDSPAPVEPDAPAEPDATAEPAAPSASPDPQPAPQ